MEDQTIIAQCTPHGSGAIALLRISGAQALHIATAISNLASGRKIAELPSHTIHFGSVVDDSAQEIDQVMFLIMHAPRSFTGENTVEITCHNNQFIIQAIINQTIKHGARLAQSGEFCKRAMLNDKIDLIQAEAINELIHANTQMALKTSLAQIKGSFSHWIADIQQELVKAMAYCQASFEFIDEEHMTFQENIKDILNNILCTIDKLKITFDQQQRIRQGIRIAIIGPVNAGKSSLFNSLLRQNRAIVTNIAGTTRDVIEAGVYKNQNYWTLIDTAGLRQTDDIIEQEGIQRSFEQAELADIILLVMDASRTIHPQELETILSIANQHQHKIITLFNKSDIRIEQTLPVQGLSISAQNQTDSQQIEELIEQKIDSLLQGAASSFLLNTRQFNLLLSLEQKCLEIIPLCTQNAPYEIISIYLQEAAADLSELTGKTISEAAMDQVFRQFCVGK